MRYEATIKKLRQLTPEQRAEKRKEFEKFVCFWNPHDKQIATQYQRQLALLDSIEKEEVDEVLA